MPWLFFSTVFSTSLVLECCIFFVAAVFLLSVSLFFSLYYFFFFIVFAHFFFVCTMWFECMHRVWIGQVISSNSLKSGKRVQVMHSGDWINKTSRIEREIKMQRIYDIWSVCVFGFCSNSFLFSNFDPISKCISRYWTCSRYSQFVCQSSIQKQSTRAIHHTLFHFFEKWIIQCLLLHFLSFFLFFVPFTETCISVPFFLFCTLHRLFKMYTQKKQNPKEKQYTQFRCMI